MKTLQKKILILLLSFSNLAVLGMVFYAYFDSHQSLLLFSTSENDKDLKEKIKKACQKQLKELVEGKRSSFICNVKVRQRQKEASYSLRTRIKVTKNDKDFAIEGQGQIRNPTQHATEAQFCNDCTRTDNVTEDNFEDVMKQVLDIAETVYFEAQDSVRKARIEYNKKDRDKRMAVLRERQCEGRWSESEEQFEEFDREERLQCKMNHISQLDLPLEIEKFYHKNLKNDLWNTALSEDDYLLEDVLNQFDNPYRNSFSVRSSTGLLKNYLMWKDDFEILDSMEQKSNFVKTIKGDVDQMTQFMTKEQSQKDLYFLNQGFEGLLARFNQTTRSLPRLSPRLKGPAPLNSPTKPISPSIDYDAVKRQTKDL